MQVLYIEIFTYHTILFPTHKINHHEKSPGDLIITLLLD